MRRLRRVWLQNIKCIKWLIKLSELEVGVQVDNNRVTWYSHVIYVMQYRVKTTENENAFLPRGQNSQDTPEIAQRRKIIRAIQREHRILD
jgi:hypothetical protein